MLPLAVQRFHGRLLLLTIAQAGHNRMLMEENDTEKEFWDAKLSPEGEAQCARLKAKIRGENVWSYKRPLNLDLVMRLR